MFYVQYVDTLEMKRRSVLGRSNAANQQGSKRTDGLKEQLANYDARLAVLRDQLRSSVDVKLRGSVAGAGDRGLAGLGSLGGTAGDAIPAVNNRPPVEGDQNAQGRKRDDDTSKDGAKKSVVERLVTATGQGCKEVLEGSLAANGTKSGSMWKTRAFKQEQVKSSCTLKLEHKKSSNITIRVTFAPGKSVPAALVFEHAPKATAEFKRVGMVALKKKSVSQTKHVFHLGNGAVVDRFLRVTCLGLIGDTKNKFHAVSFLLVSGDRAEIEGGEDGGDDHEAIETSASIVTGESVSEGVYKGDEAEFRVSLDCGDLEGTLAESGRKTLGVQNVQNVKSNTRKRATASQSSVSVWERLSNYKPVEKGTGAPQPKIRVPGVSVTSSRTGKSSQAPHSPPAALQRSLLSSERVAFVEGVLGSLGIGGMEAAELIKNVVFGNSSFVSSLAQDQIDGLVECLPTTEERKMFRSLDHVPGANEAEYFLAELVAIDNLAAKVETKWFLADFDARVSVVQDASNLISTACHEIQDCSKLHLAIRIILSECSETLQGVKLLDVNLLKELKGVTYNEQGSLLHFVAAKLSEAAGTMKVPNLARDLPSCAPATQVTLNDVKAELELLMDGVDEASLAWRADEPAASTVHSRLDTARSKLSSTEAIVTETEADFLECAINSGLDPASINSSEELLQALLDFSDDLNNAHLENKCIGFLTKSNTVDQEVKATQPKAKQELKVNARRTRATGQQSTTSAPSPVSEPSRGQTVAPGASVGVSNVPSFGANLIPGVSSLVTSPESRRAPATGSQTPMASRVSVEQLMHSAQKTMPLSASVVSTACDDNIEAISAVEKGEVFSASEELSTPVRNLLRSSRALIDSFDLRNVSNVSPIKYLDDSDIVQGPNAAHDEPVMDEQWPEEEARLSAEVPMAGPSSADDDHLCEMSSPREDLAASHSQGAPAQKAETVEEIQPDEDAADIREEVQSEPTARSQRKTLTPEQIAATIDLGLANKLLMNADKVKASRSSGSSVLMKSARLATTPRSLRTSQVPVLGSRGRSSNLRYRTHDIRESNVSGPFVTPERSGQLVNNGHGQVMAVQADAPQSPHTNLTPQQANAVQALGEVIRQSMPSFASLESDKQCGLHLEAQNLDLDKILSTIILNAGNTPTGPLARGVRGGNESLFDGEGAEELRRHEQIHGSRAHRKALLEPIVPAPLGMGVSVSNTVSKGISPQTLARSLQSSMRASVSVPMHSTLSHDQAKRRSVKGSVQFPTGATTAAIGNSSANRTPMDDRVLAQSQTHPRDSKVSRGVAKSYSNAVSKDYSKAPTWREEPSNRSEEGKLNAKPVFMARPNVNINDIRDGGLNGTGLSTKPELTAEDLDAIPTPQHGFDMHDDEAYGLSPLGFPGQEDQDSMMAKDRMENLWGMRWE